MAGWADVALAMGSAATGGLLTGVFLLINSKKEHKASLERLEVELAAARDKDERERRRAVRGEPLLTLRAALAELAAIGIYASNIPWVEPSSQYGDPEREQQRRDELHKAELAILQAVVACIKAESQLGDKDRDLAFRCLRVTNEWSRWASRVLRDSSQQMPPSTQLAELQELINEKLEQL